LGNEVLVLVNDRKLVGNHRVEFDGRGLNSGLYFYRIKSGEFVETRKLILLK
jgi:hypothetical protein